MLSSARANNPILLLLSFRSKQIPIRTIQLDPSTTREVVFVIRAISIAPWSERGSTARQVRVLVTQGSVNPKRDPISFSSEGDEGDDARVILENGLWYLLLTPHACKLVDDWTVSDQQFEVGLNCIQSIMSSQSKKSVGQRINLGKTSHRSRPLGGVDLLWPGRILNQGDVGIPNLERDRALTEWS